MSVTVKGLIKWPLRKAYAALRGGRIASTRLMASAGIHPTLRRSELADRVDWQGVGLLRGDYSGLARFVVSKKFERTRYCLDREDLGWYKDADPFGGHKNLLERAERILQGSLDIAGVRVQLDGDRVPWRRDPVSGAAAWSHWAAHRPRRDLDTKFWIELNLHRHFAPLARAGLISGDTRFESYLRGQWRNWLRQNPPIDEEYISDGLELSLRVLAWTDLAFVLGERVFPESDAITLLALVDRYGAMIERQCDGNNNRNNHLAAEAWGLFFIGTMYPELTSSARWRNKGMSVLADAVVEQFSPAGVHAERALGYQLFVAEIVASAIHLAERNGFVVPDALIERLSACTDYLASLCRADGSMPAYGDEGMPFFSPTGQTRVRPQRVMALLRRALKRPARPADQAWAEEVFWLTGRATGDAETEPVGEAACERHNFDGHVVMRTERTHVHFDCACHGMGKRAGHGHDDALSFDYFHDGMAWIGDAGTYTYCRSGSHREYFAGALAHSGVLFNGRGAGQMVAEGAFGWVQKADAVLLNAGDTGEFCWAVGRHLGCADTDGGFPEVERFLVMERSGVLLVVDTCTAQGTLDSIFHLTPAVEAQVRSDGAMLVSGARRLAVASKASQPQDVTLHSGADDALPGWHSPDYGVVVPTSVVRVRSEIAGAFWRVTALAPDSSPSEPFLEVQQLGPARLRCTVDRQERRLTWDVNLEERSVMAGELVPQC